MSFRITLHLAVLLALATIVGAGWRDIFRSNPDLTDEQKEWKIFPGETGDSDSTKFPFRIVEHGYKFIRIYWQEGRKTPSGEIPRIYLVEWGWKMTVQNVSGEANDLSIEYFLKDKDNFTVISDYHSTDLIAPWKTHTIYETGILRYDEAVVKRIAYGTWKANLGMTSMSRIWQQRARKLHR